MIAGKEQPDSGTVNIGKTVQLAFVDQSRESLPDDKTVFDAVSDGADLLTVGRFEMPSRAYLGRFNFKGADQNKMVGKRSEEHTSELQSLMRISYAVFCLKNKKRKNLIPTIITI